MRGGLLGFWLLSNINLMAQLATNLPATETKPVTPTYRVEHYQLVGSSVFNQAEVDRLTDDVVGAAVNLAEIRRALTRLQTAYRNRGYKDAALLLPRQPLANGIVRVNVSEGLAVSSAQAETRTDLPGWTVPTYDVRHFVIQGNTVLSPEKIDRIFSPLANGSVTQEQIQKALAQLRTVYEERGYPAASVRLPEQILTDGTLTVQVTEGWSSSVELAAHAARTTTNAVTPPAERTFEVRHYEVIGNTLLRQETIDQVFTNATGTAVSFAQLKKALGELQLAYRERGYATVSVGLPQQQLTNATIKVQVTEGKLVAARVTGNRYFSSNNVMSQLPTLREALIWKDEVPNSRVFQRELDIANQNRDRQIYPTLSPGPDPGTTVLDLRVKDRFPLHGRLEVNNQATPGTPPWRINASANYANLWQREHQIGLSYGFTPDAYKANVQPDYLLNRPLVANGGAYYRIPFGESESVSQRINSSGNFGYDEATRQFRLPPAGARPDFTLFASAATSDTGVKYGEVTTVTSSTNNPTITSQDSGQNLSDNYSIGARLNIPWVLSDTARYSFSGGLDWKQSVLESYNTNNITSIYTFSDPNLGDQEIIDVTSTGQPVQRNEVQYLPLVFGTDYSQTDKGGTFSASFGLAGNFTGNAADFRASSYSTNAQVNYGKLTLALTRDQKVFGNWSLLLRAGGQAATGPLISNEQFALGGLNTVRGYYEGDEYGDSGWFGSVELRTPFLTTEVAVVGGFTPVWLRGSIFVDGGQAFLLDGAATSQATVSLAGVGFALSANINNRMDARITVGVPLRNSANTEVGNPRVYFSLGGQF